MWSHLPSGRSPRVRGSRDLGDVDHAGLRSIPACAGEPRPFTAARATPRVDPRVCGGALCVLHVPLPSSGRSPRVRGSLIAMRLPAHVHGSIPACAGEPSAAMGVTARPKVDPRVCGGARRKRKGIKMERGRSPRVRGSPDRSCCRTASTRSIPACAGEPFINASASLGVGVDPRVCGGAPRGTGMSVSMYGSIPACAGEPRA